MAIIIPSKNIYEIDNQKIKKNVVDNVSIEQTIVNSNNEYDKVVFNEKISLETITNGEKSQLTTGKRHDIPSGDPSVPLYYYEGISLSYEPKIVTTKIKINKTLENSYIKKIYKGIDENGNYKINVSIRYDIYKDQNATAEIGKVLSGNGEIQNIKYKLPETPSFSKTENSDFVEVKYSNGSLSVDLTNDIKEKNNIDLTGELEYVEQDNYFEFKITFIAGYLKQEFWGESNYSPSSFWAVSGIVEQAVARLIEVSVNGDTIGISLINNSIHYENGNKPYSLNGNELLQNVKGVTLGKEEISADDVHIYNKGNEIIITKAPELKDYDIMSTFVCVDEYGLNTRETVYIPAEAISSNIVNTNGGLKFMECNFISGYKILKTYISEYLATNILSQYRKGKETASLLCDINDYYDENGKKVIDIKTNNMSFHIGDEVVPMVYTASGEDEPMSRYQNGDQKVFVVVGRDIIYDGAVWQRLYLQEKSQ